MPKFDSLQASLKAAAVGGILMAGLTLQKRFSNFPGISSQLRQEKKFWRLSEKPCVKIAEMFTLMTILT